MSTGFDAGSAGHAHFDIVHRWRWSEIEECAATENLGGLLRRMAEHPDAPFAQREAGLHESLERRAPALFEDIRRRVRARRWFPVGGMWAEPGMNPPAGESASDHLPVS